MSNGNTITLVVTAETAQAAQNMATFVKQTGSGLQVVKQEVAQMGQEAAKAGAHVAGMSYYFRSGIDSIRFALAGGGERAGFYAVDEAVRGLISSGMKLGTLVPVIGGIAVAAGAVVLAIHEWNAGTEEQIKHAKDLADAWKQIPGTIKQIADLQQAGLLSPQAAANFADIATGRKKLYVDASGKVTTSPGETVTTPAQAAEFGSSPYMDPARTTFVNNRAATFEEGQKYLQDQLTAAGGMTKEQLDALNEAHDELQKFNEESLEGIDKQKQEVIDRYAEERRQMEMTLAELRATMDGTSFQKSKQAKDLQAALAAMPQRQKTELAQLDLKEAQDNADQAKEATDKLVESERKVTEELKRQQQLRAEIARGQTEAHLREIEGNPLLTDQQKNAQSVPIYQQMLAQNQARIQDLSHTAATTNDPAAALEAQKQIVDLTEQQVKLQQQLNAAAGAGSWSYQMQQLVTQFGSFPPLAQQVKDSILQIRDQGINSIASNMTKVIEGAENWQRALRDVGRTLITDVLNSILQIIEKQLINLAIDIAIKAVTGGIGFAEGGYTGDGNPSDVAGIVHKGEYVLPASAVQRIGFNNLRALHEGAPLTMDGGSATGLLAQGRGGAAGQGGGSNVNLHLWDRRPHPKDYLDSSDGQNHVIEIVKGNRRKIGIAT